MQAKWGLDILLTACFQHECHTNIHGFTCYSTNQCSALVNSAYSVISWTFYALKSSLSASRRSRWWYVWQNRQYGWGALTMSITGANVSSHLILPIYSILPCDRINYQ